MSEAKVPAGSILVVDDDATIRKILRDRLAATGYDVSIAADGEAALAQVEALDPDLVVLDLEMPKMDGFAVLEALRRRARPPAIVVLTAHGSIEAAIRAVRSGASDLVTKPFDAAHLEHVLRGVLDRVGLRRRVEDLETELSDRHRLVLGKSRAMQEAHSVAMRAAVSDATVLLLGESGTGKEVLARAIHQASRRSKGPFVAMNCAALSAELLESELFGHEKGAFTGAVRCKPGRFELAGGGTLFLDEVGELSAAVQAKLLRVLQERELERVGGTRTIAVDVRVLAATNRDLAREMEEGRFRKDLYYRLNVVAVRLPPLRERAEDVLALAEHFLRRLSLAAARPGMRFTAEAKAALVSYSWPGNVREVANVVERTVVLSVDDCVGAEVLPDDLRDGAASIADARESTGFHAAVADAKRAIIVGALEKTGGHQTRAAALLGLTQPYLARLVKTLGMKES